MGGVFCKQKFDVFTSWFEWVHYSVGQCCKSWAMLVRPAVFVWSFLRSLSRFSGPVRTGPFKSEILPGRAGLGRFSLKFSTAWPFWSKFYQGQAGPDYSARPKDLQHWRGDRICTFFAPQKFFKFNKKRKVWYRETFFDRQIQIVISFVLVPSRRLKMFRLYIFENAKQRDLLLYSKWNSFYRSRPILFNPINIKIFRVKIKTDLIASLFATT